MSTRFMALVLAALHLALTQSGNAQQPGTPRIGYLSARAKPSEAAPDSNIDALRAGLRDLGYVEGKNIIIEYRYSDGINTRLSEFAADLVRLKVDLIVSAAVLPSLAAKKATSIIPIIISGVGDPVAFGLVKSLSRPGGNITGLTNFSPELSGKRVEFLKEARPHLVRMAILRDPRQPPQSFTESQKAAQFFGIKVQSVEIQDITDVETAFSAMAKQRTEGFITLAQTVFNINRKRILELATKHRLPSVYGDKVWAEAGGLMSYGPDPADINRRAAVYVDKILKGAKPADLPVEQPTKFEFLVNLKTAKQISVTIPPNVLARADRVIR